MSRHAWPSGVKTDGRNSADVTRLVRSVRPVPHYGGGPVPPTRSVAEFSPRGNRVDHVSLRRCMPQNTYASGRSRRNGRGKSFAMEHESEVIMQCVYVIYV